MVLEPVRNLINNTQTILRIKYVKQMENITGTYINKNMKTYLKRQLNKQKQRKSLNKTSVIDYNLKW